MPDREKWSAFVGIAIATFLTLVGALVVFAVALAPQADLRVLFFGAVLLSVGASWLCDASFATRLYTRDPDLWYELGRPEVNQPWGPGRYRKLYFRRVPAGRYPRGLWVQHQVCRLLLLLWIGLCAALVVVCLRGH